MSFHTSVSSVAVARLPVTQEVTGSIPGPDIFMLEVSETGIEPGTCDCSLSCCLSQAVGLVFVSRTCIQFSLAGFVFGTPTGPPRQ